MLTYTNPVYPHYFADPFVLAHDGQYYAYGTSAPSPEGNHFPILSSTNLRDWSPAGWALHAPQGVEFWAPEVVYHEGIFYLYYSARIEPNDHQLRVATSRVPQGPFMDSGRVLVADQPFSIDPHPFRTDDGQWYLYYSRDFLTLDAPYRVGTGIVVDRLVNMLELAGNPQLVVRPFADWHLFRAQRAMYGGIYDWHTVEGAAARLHNERVYCFYSGGAWEHENYGISYVVAEHPLGPYHAPDNSFTPLIKTIPEEAIGPGHNSFVTAPDGVTEYCVYHAWDAAMSARLMRIDLLTWQADRPVIHGPSIAPQPLVGFGDP